MTMIETGFHPEEQYTALLYNYEANASQLFESKKAIIEGRMTDACGVLPPDVVLSRDIVKARDADNLRYCLYEAVDHGFHAGIRTCFRNQPPKSPWVMGVNSHEKVDQFMDETYPQWLGLKDLSEIIVMHNPPLLGLPEERENHFVFRLRKSASNGYYMEMRLGTDQLRSIENHTKGDDLITGTINKSIIGFKNMELKIGSTYTGNGTLELAQAQPDFWVNGLNTNGHIPAHTKAVVEQAIKGIQQLDADPHTRLYQRLQSFSEIGLDTSEWQGRMSEHGVDWMRIYGFRGEGDDTSWV